MGISEKQLRLIMPNSGSLLTPHLPYINEALSEFDINTPERISAFIAQLAHESCEFQFMEELADGSAYEGREDLGNFNPGDGRTYKGHGPIQITGKNNHKACGEALGIDLINHPKLICTPEYAVRSSCWFWNSRHLSLLADVNWFKTITYFINGGYTHLDERVKYWNKARVVLGLNIVNIELEQDNIKVFQQAHGLIPDGVVGQKTLKALGA